MKQVIAMMIAAIGAVGCGDDSNGGGGVADVGVPDIATAAIDAATMNPDLTGDPADMTVVDATRPADLKTQPDLAEPTCDPIAQNCPPPMFGVTGCIVDFNSQDGSGHCLNVAGPQPDGSPCRFLNECEVGMLCYSQRCRRYCRQGGALPQLPCPMGQVCSDIMIVGLMVKFHADRTGICQ